MISKKRRVAGKSCSDGDDSEQENHYTNKNYHGMDDDHDVDAFFIGRSVHRRNTNFTNTANTFPVTFPRCVVSDVRYCGVA